MFDAAETKQTLLDWCHHIGTVLQKYLLKEVVVSFLNILTFSLILLTTCYFMEWAVSFFGWFPELSFFHQPDYDPLTPFFLLAITVINWGFKEFTYAFLYHEELQAQSVYETELPVLRIQSTLSQSLFQMAEAELIPLRTKYQDSLESNQQNEAQINELRAELAAQVAARTKAEKALAEVTEKWVKAEERATEARTELIEPLLLLLGHFRQKIDDYEAGLITENTLHHRQKKADTQSSSGDKDKWDRNLL